MTAMQIVPILISVVSLVFAIWSGTKTQKRTENNEIREDAAKDQAVLIKLESIQEGMTEMKVEIRNYREEMQQTREQQIRNEESLKQLHKRVDKVEQLVEMHGLNK